MQRKPGFPVANCSIKMPDGALVAEAMPLDDEAEQLQRRQQLINFGHTQWGFNNWSWSVTKQDLDFVDFSNGKYCVGVVAFVSVTVKTFDIHRENIGYATTVAHTKGMAIYKARKTAVTNALRETLLSFGGTVATELLEAVEIREVNAPVPLVPPPVELPEVKPVEPKNAPLNRVPRKEDVPANCTRTPHGPPVKNAAHQPPVLPVPPSIPKPPPPGGLAPPRVRPPGPPAPVPGPPGPMARGSNVSFVLQPVVGGMVPPLYGPRLPPVHSAPPMYPPFYEYGPGPWHFAIESYDRPHGNVNLNFNLPPKNLVVNGRAGSVECKNACGVRAPAPEGEYGAQGCWIKPTIFYDGFWTEQKVKKWVAEQVEKQFPEDASKSSSPSNPPDSSASKS